MNNAGRPIRTNFTTGEISPRLYGRTDLEQYQDAAAVIENFMVMAAGGLTRRSGSTFAALNGLNTRVRMIPFIVSNLTAYALEFGQGYIHFFAGRGPVLDTAGNALTLASPYQVADLRLIRYAQSADVLFLAHGSYPPMQLSRTGINAFTLGVAPITNGPFNAENTGDIGAPGANPAATQDAAAIVLAQLLQPIAVAQAAAVSAKQDQGAGDGSGGTGRATT